MHSYMCFSAAASFTASAVLATAGIASIRSVKERSKLPFAGIALIFSVQQFAEGILWIALTSDASAAMRDIPTHLFLLFAQVVWPVWVPLSILAMEKERWPRLQLKIILGFGVAIAGYLAFCISVYDVHASVVGRHISYALDFPHEMKWLAAIIYFVPTVIPPFLSSVRRMRLLGVAILGSYVITTFFFHEFIISVWCFFAAVLSGVIYFVLRVPEERRDSEMALRKL